MQKYLRHSVACLSLIFFAQFSQDSSIAGTEKPRVNFFGTVIDKSGNTYKAENIMISGAYKQIVMYIKPSNPDIAPKSHIAPMDLAEGKEIRIVYDGDKPKIKTYNKKEYIELEIISRDTNQTKNTYIIERNKKLFFDEPNEAGPKEHSVELEVLDKIIIDGYKERAEQRKTKKIAKNYRVKSYKVI